MKVVVGALFDPILSDKDLKLQNNKKGIINDESKALIIKSERDALITIFSYFFISFLVLFSLYILNSKHTLLLFLLQMSFFIVIPLFFHNTRAFLKDALNYLNRLGNKNKML